MTYDQVVWHPGHECNAYCRDGCHAGVAYSQTQYAEGLVKLAYVSRGYELVSFEPAPEAPPKYDGVSYAYRWLVVWRHRERAG